jgi:Fic family protein
MFVPSYHISSEILSLVAEISEQIGILETLSGEKAKLPEELPNPLEEIELLRAHEKFNDGLSDRAGRYRQDDPRVRLQMSMLFDWLANTTEQPLVRSCIFHYELVDIHPFLVGNEHLGLYWQTLILAQWRPILGSLPLEAMIVERKDEYYRMMATIGETAKMTHFIAFILRCLLDVILQEVKNKVESKVKNKSREKVQDKTSENALHEGAAAPLSKSEQRVVKLLETEPRITIGGLAQRLQLSEAGINKVLAALRKKGIIERVGANKNGSWKVNV